MSDGSDPVVAHLVEWGAARDDVRAMILTSTRAVPGAKLDALSDYDVIVVTTDIDLYVADHRWLDAFGEVVVAYHDPVTSFEDTASGHSGNVVQYAGTLKIDFSLWPVALLQHLVAQAEPHPEFDAGYRVLLDKDGLTANLPAPTYSAYIPQRPDDATFQTIINDFFIGAPYVAKCLLRDEILPGKWCFDYDMRYVYLLPMLEWRAQCDHGWAVPVGSNGKGLKRLLPPEVWSAFEGTFAGAGIAEGWDALFRMMALFEDIGRYVAAALGYTYPAAFAQGVTDHVRQMRELDLSRG